MIISKSVKYFQKNANINKKANQRTAYKIQVYANNKVDELVKDYNDGKPDFKHNPSSLYGELAILNKPEVYKNYNRILNSKYTSNDNLNKMLINNKANKELNRVVEGQLERLSKNLDYAEQVLKQYEVPTKKYQQLLNEQKNKSVANRQEILKKVAIQENGLLASEGLNIPSHVFSYKDIGATAENLLRQSKMASNHEEALAVNQNYIDDGKDAPYTHKVWIHTHAGKTTRHMSNHMQTVLIDEPFIVVNDNTLEIDEMMYPSDPAGSFGNSWICYCECDYVNEDKVVENTDTVTLNNTVFNVPVGSGAISTSMGEVPAVTFSNKVNPEVFEKPAAPVGEYIDTTDLVYSKALNQYYVSELDGLKLNAATGKYEINGLTVDNVSEAGIGKIPKNKLDEHNAQFKPEEQKINTEKLTGEVKKPIDESILTELDYESYDIDPNMYPELAKNIKLNNATGKYEYNGLEIKGNYELNGYGYLYKNDVAAHNKQAGEPVKTVENKVANEVTSKKEVIDTYLLEELNSESYHIDGAFHKVVYNENTGNWEYKGLKVEGYDEKYQTGLIYKKDVEAHNKELGIEPAAKPKKDGEYILVDEDGVLTGDKDTYVIDGDEVVVTYNETTGKYEHKGLVLDEYDPDIAMGKVSKAALEAHNKNYDPSATSEPALNNKYINSVNSIKAVKENNEVFLEDKTTGKKYVYDQKAKYEQKQDTAQHKVNYTVKETESTTHWGRYGHQTINGLIYKVKRFDEYTGRVKQDYSYYGKWMDKLTPHYNKLQDLAIWENEGSLPYEQYMQQKNEIMGKMEKIIETVKDPYNESHIPVKDAKRAMWEIMDMDSAVEKAPNLLQDTFFVRFGHFNKEWLQVGKVVEYDGYTSTTYESGAASHFEDKMASNPNKWAILVMADEGSNGVRLNNQFDAYTTEREWMLARRQKFEVVEFNEQTRTVVIKLIN